MSSRSWLLGALLLLQGADVVLTWRLLTARPDVGEANPLALAVLERHGWSGAVVLKAASTAVALGCVLLVSRLRPAFSRPLLTGLCAIVLAVVGYSAVLLVRPEQADEGPLADSLREAARVDEQRARMDELMRAREALCVELLAGRLSLPEAVERMSAHLRAGRERLLPTLRAGWPAAGCPGLVAAYLVLHCTRAPHGPPPRLRDELDRHYPEGVGGTPSLSGERRSGPRR